MERNKIIIISVSVVVGLAVLGGLIWLIVWLVTKDGDAAAAKALLTNEECEKFGKDLWGYASTDKKIVKSDLEAWFKELSKGLPLGDLKFEAKEDITAEEKLVAMVKENRTFAFLLRDAHTMFKALDKSGDKKLSGDELKPMAVNEEGDKLVALVDADGSDDVSFTEFAKLMGLGYFKHGRNFIWAAGGADHKLHADEFMAVMVHADKDKVEKAAGSDKIFDLQEFFTMLAAEMTTLGVTIDYDKFDTMDAWNAWIMKGIAAFCKDGTKYKIEKLKDKKIEIAPKTGADDTEDSFIKNYQKDILEKMTVPNPGATANPAK